MPKETLISGDLEARGSRWGALISELEDDWDGDGDSSDNASAPGLSSMPIPPSRSSNLALPVFGGGPSPKFPFGGGNESSLHSTFSTKPSPQPFSQPWTSRGAGGSLRGGLGAGLQFAPQSSSEALTVKDWIASHQRRGDGEPMDISELRKYLEKSVSILHSLVRNIVGYRGNNGSMSKEDQIQVHPNFITLENVIVRTVQLSFMGGEEVTTDFVKCGDSIFCNNGEDESRKMYLAMNALGRMAYEMFMLGEGHSSFNFCAKSNDAVMLDDADNIDEEDEIIAMLRKNPRTITSEKKDNSGVMSVMLDANISFPLCRFVSDLLDDEHAISERSERSFISFADIEADLKQMKEKPEAFLHESSPDRWKLIFGEKLYGRYEQSKAFMDAADRISITGDDPLFCGILGIAGRRKEVVMVGGNSGSGKSKLVRSGGASLQKKGWRFLRCKFDRVVHPEPLSIISYAFDEYFGSFACCPDHETNDMRECLERISPEGLGILVKHSPSLRLVLTGEVLPTNTSDVNESRMHSLFGNLLKAISSKRTPVIFFIDDLQWADPLSLALLTSLVKGAMSDLLNLNQVGSGDQNSAEHDIQAGPEYENKVMFVGSYRDNEVDEDHPFAKVLRNLELDVSINVTNISLSGFTLETLNQMLSESLCVPLRRVRSLSELVVQKTDGQPLHVIEFIQALTMDNLLTHSFERGWEWDADSIEICQITDSVAELFAFKLRRLPKEILRGLQILSCFGSQIDQHILRLVGNYDGENSVDIPAAINVALSEGLIERAAQFVSFAHDMIQQATIDSISDSDLVPLLRKLASALITNASAESDLDSALFVIVDLINRIGSDATSSPKERALFAELNSQAGSKAIAVPDFAGASKYAENGISFLSDCHWETQYGLSLRLYETAVASCYSSIAGNRDQLNERIDAVFEHAKNFSDKFKTHCIWVTLISMTDHKRASQESLNALEQLGEPLDLTNVDYTMVCEELVKRKKQFAGDRKQKLLSSNQLDGCNKARAMKIMSSLMTYYHSQQSSLGAFVSCQMIKMSLDFGHCEDSVFGAGMFAANLVTILEDFDEGTAWAHSTLSLMERYNKNTVIPFIYGALYGMVLVWKEPVQSTLEPLAQAIRISFSSGNVQSAMVNTSYYVARSFNCGKHLGVLKGEVEALARQHSNHFGTVASSKLPVYNPILHFYLTPIYNTLLSLGGYEHHVEESETEEGVTSFPFDKVSLVNNEDILKCTLEAEKYPPLFTVLTCLTIESFMMRDMNSALRSTDIYCELFLNKQLRAKFVEFYNVFYEGLIAFYFMRQTGDEVYKERGVNALKKMKEWSIHSDWNYKNKLLLMEAEYHNTQKDYANAAICYETSIKAAQDHKHIHEEAISHELAGTFFFERGLHQKSYLFYRQSIECYKKWGANAVVRRVEKILHANFDTDLMHDICPIETVFLPVPSEELSTRKKRLFSDNS